MSEFERDRYYCAHCPLVPEAESWSGAYVAKKHVESVHELRYNDIVEGEDVYQGWQAQKKWDARQIVANADFKTPWRGDATYSVDDFLTDIGDEPFETRLCYEDDE
jgi:hypothetical protein